LKKLGWSVIRITKNTINPIKDIDDKIRGILDAGGEAWRNK